MHSATRSYPFRELSYSSSTLSVSAKLRDAARAAAEAADTRNCPPDELAKKQELLDLNVFRVLQCAENIASGTYKMVQFGNVVREIERKRNQMRSQNKETVNCL